MKKFYESWTDREIDEYLRRDKKVLILFDVHLSTKEAQIVIYGELNESQKFLLKAYIANDFDGEIMSDELVVKINKYADDWYYRYVERAPIRLINLGNKKK